MVTASCSRAGPGSRSPSSEIALPRPFCVFAQSSGRSDREDRGRTTVRRTRSTGRLGDGWVSKEWENGELKKENQSLRSELARLRKEAQREVQVRIEKIKDLNWTIAKKQEQAKQSERRLAEAKQANASLNRRIFKLNNPQTSPAPPTKARGTKCQSSFASIAITQRSR